MVTLVFTASCSSDNKQANFSVSEEEIIETTEINEKTDLVETEKIAATSETQSESPLKTVLKQDEISLASETEYLSTKKPDLIQANISDNKANNSSEMEVHFLNVGQGDSTLIICDGKAMLIDGGGASKSSLIYAYLKERNINELEYIVATHGHEDHVGGLSGALNYATAKKAISSTLNYESKAFTNFLNYLGDTNLESVNLGKEYDLGSAKFYILAPREKSDNENNNSVVIKLIHGDNVFLFTGDMEREEEQDILNAGTDIKADVLKVGHHGSDTSTTYPFLREVMPTYGVISVGENNQYGHPHENTLSRLRDADVKVLRTDMQGHIIIKSDGKDLTYEVQKNRDVDTLAAVGKNSIQRQDETKEQETTDQSSDISTEVKYILNTNTKKFHKPGCSSVKQMKPENKQESSESRDDIISQGYEPCKRCNP